jgi:hypothetical protein
MAELTTAQGYASQLTTAASSLAKIRLDRFDRETQSKMAKHVLELTSLVQRLGGSIELFDRFVADCVEPRSGAITSTSDIRKTYKDWCRVKKVTPIQLEIFEALLSSNGWAQHKSKGTVAFLEIGLKDMNTVAIISQYQQLQQQGQQQQLQGQPMMQPVRRSVPVGMHNILGNEIPFGPPIIYAQQKYAPTVG